MVDDSQKLLLERLLEQKVNAEKYADLPEETRKFLEQLRPDEIEMLAEGIGLVKSLKMVSRLTKRAIILLVGAFVGGMVLYKEVLEFFAMLKGVSK